MLKAVASFNKKKIRNSLILAVAVAFVFTVPPSLLIKDLHKYSIVQRLFIAIVGAIPVSIFLGLGMLAEFWMIARKHARLFNSHWTHFFEWANFKSVFLYESKRFHFTENVLLKNIDSFPVLAYTEPQHIVFSYRLEWQQLNKGRYDTLSQHFKSLGAEFGIGEINMKFRYWQDVTGMHILQQLEEFAIILKAENFKPDLNIRSLTQP